MVEEDGNLEIEDDEEEEEEERRRVTRSQNQLVVSEEEEEDWEAEISNSKLCYAPEDLLSPGVVHPSQSHPSRVSSPWPVQVHYHYTPSVHHTPPVLWEHTAALTITTADQFEDAEEE
ncbi:uncharacterized protein ACWYII_044008 isoform 1-T3 [Salvelinus alpinus]